MDSVVRVDIDGTAPLSWSAVELLRDTYDRVEAADTAPVVVLHCAGAPPADHETTGVDVHLVNKWESALRRVERSAAVTVGAATGVCGGIALEALLVTDFRVAAAGARLRPPRRAGQVWPGMVIYRLATLLGVAGARRAVLLGADLPAEPDLVDEVTADLDGRLAELAGELAGAGGADLAVRRRLLLDAATVSFEDALGTHLAACDRVLRR